MTANIFPDGKFQGIGNDGLVVPNGTLHVVDTATQTPQTTYRDSILSSANTIPIVLSASGKADVFLIDNTYDITLKDSADVVIWTITDYKPFNKTFSGSLDISNTNTNTVTLENPTSNTEDLTVDVSKIIHFVDTIADFRSMTEKHNFVSVTGYYSKDDGAFGTNYYKWIPASTDTDNNGTIIKLDSEVTGRYELQYTGAANVKFFGAVEDADSTTAFTDYLATFNQLVVHKGNYTLTNITIDKHMYFREGASIESVLGATVTITNSITSSKQFIFKGVGDYSIGNDTDSGEDARHLHASWFGAFTNPSLGADQAPMINKAFASVGNLRESIVDFDIGNYNISSAITVTRGGHVKGSGIRRTVFKLDSDGYDVFTTSGEACKFSDLQFELHLGTITDRINGAFIKIDDNNAEIFNVSTTTAKKSIIINGNNTRVKEISCLFTGNSDADSSMIELNASNCSISDINMLSTTDGSESVINIGAGGTTTISGFSIENVNNIAPSACVKINNAAGNVTRGYISNIRYNGFAGTTPTDVILIETVGTSSIDFINIDGVYASNYITNGITINQGSTGTTKDITMNNINYELTGYGLGLTRTDGNLREVFLGTANIGGCTTPISKTGVMTNIRISAIALFPLVNPSVSYDTTIADDGVYLIDLGTDIFTGTVIVTAGFTNYGFFSIRAAVTPGNIGITLSANVDAATGVLTGTTGVDGNVTVSADADGLIYIENRTGASQRVCATVNVAIIRNYTIITERDNMSATTVITAKSVSTGGISVLLLTAFNDVEFVMLLITGVFASIMSYMYDWTHREVPLKFGVVELTELLKSIFYGIPMMFIVYYFGINNTGEYVDIPVFVWGFIAMISAGSAVTIVEWFAPMMGNLATAILGRKK